MNLSFVNPALDKTIAGDAQIAAIYLFYVYEKNVGKKLMIMQLIKESIFSVVVAKLDSIISLLNELVEEAGINKNYLTVLLKVTGISYIVELAKNICIDAGSNSLATKLEMAGKVSVVVLTIPVITSVIEMIVSIV